VNPHDPDPLVVLEDRLRDLKDRLPDVSKGPKTFGQQESVRAGLDPWLAARIAILVALAFGLGLFVGVRFAAATSRPAPEHVVPASVQGPIGAPLERDAGTASDGGADGGGAPSPVTVFEDTSPGITGTASFVSASYGPRYLALPGGPGIRVMICGRGGCVTRTSTDAGPSLFRQRQGRIADLSHADFFAVCGCPSWAGLTQVTVTPAGPRPTPPATDATP
jgi:hypothetical protein